MASEHQTKLKELASFMQDKGFVYGPSPEIYGGLAGFFDYGPLGKLLKNNIENAIRKVFCSHQFFEVECPTVLPREVWEASGHLGGFTDPLIKDENNNIFRVDNLIEEFFRNKSLDLDDIQLDGASNEYYLEIIKKYNITAPDGAKLIPEIKEHNLMMKTTIGVDREAYNRPETATTTYLPFLRYLNFFREKLPFGVFQIGKAYRNEISPRQFMLRMREFTQAEAQIFLFEEQKNNFEQFVEVADMKLPLWRYEDQADPLKSMLDSINSRPTLAKAVEKGYLKNQAYAWTLALAYQVFLAMGIPENKIRLRQHNPAELAFYAEDAWDLEIELTTFGWTEVCGIHDRKNYDLSVHAKASGTKLEATKPEGGKEVPHILEIAFGTDRPTFALLDLFYELKEKDEGKTTFSIPYHMAPIPIMIFPLVNKLNDDAYKLFKTIQKDFVCWYDKSGSVGKRYLRADSIGTPFCITVDFDGDEDDSVTIRDRDSSAQKRVKVEELKSTLDKLLKGQIKFSELK
jgi:glycyl-tRNA synthetase